MFKEEQIGRLIRKLRLERKMTQQMLADACGLTKGYLSKIENSKTAPPVSTLINIARALGVEINVFFSNGRPETSITLVKARDRVVVARDGSSFGYSYEPLAHTFPNRKMDPYLLTLPVKVKKQKVFQHEGQEMLFVLEGTMKFFHGDQEFIVEEGDCIYFDASVPHYGVCLGDKEVKCLMVIYSA
ncbi:helix-turn-helix domain-containing protein [Thermodesulforhabdus norvegica]|uniref:Transcriptional regulator, XRE family with cupin sensor n=1 Tax=Thermodesulforhabdus norvegica TaxID=39841 RepID=A0A1I4W338_9BACT|nr:XRE family transcriptional regulator [Thermodesulforhabdus norvegica]SFN07883.1 transcriptional regulator, XRE family with cupin sensor [Thermodesulforhabdus norvegica]